MASTLRAGLLEHAFRQGVNLLDLSSSREPQAAETLVGALRSQPEGLVVLSRLPAGPSDPRPEQWSEVHLRRAVTAAAKRLRRPKLDLLAMDLTEFQTARRADAVATLDALVREGALGGVAVRLPRGGMDPREVDRLLSEHVATFLAPWSLLEREAEHDLLPRLGSVGGRLLALDPHSGGALDGRRALSSPFDRAPGEPPPDLAELRRQMAPVLALGFLTSGRRRTLVEAAIRFALDPREVAAALCPLVDPKLTEAICGFERSAPFTSEERHRLGLPAAIAPS
ncbi:MAG: aldo/keto reductase [Thermoplasmata archaeon]|nr:aldo/keto reductase [Thermoplasmata archaeon]